MTSTVFLIIIICLVVIILILAFIFLMRRRKALPTPSQAANTSGKQIYIGNLAYHVKENDLRKHFAKCGDINDIRVIRHAKTRRSKGYAFVTFVSNQHAQKALSSHGQEFMGRTMVVRIAKTRPHV